jgi:hypothetical protein
MRSLFCVAVSLSLLVPAWAAAAEPNLPLLFRDDFQEGADRWAPSDPQGWRIEEIDGRKVYNQHKKQSNYNPPHRSPYNFSLVKDLKVTDFVLTAKVKSTVPEYGHRDACLFFGFQAPDKYHYVHFATKGDDRANQIFIVNGAPREKISETTSPGVKWTDGWHTLRVERTVEDGKIRVYFDDLEKPIMTATDKTFTWGQVGIGSFDDTTIWSEVTVHGRKAEEK